jgi:hypothetical protein
MRQDFGTRPFAAAAVKESGKLYGIELLIYEELKRALQTPGAHLNSGAARNPRTIVTATFAKLFPDPSDKNCARWFYALAASCMRRLLVERATARLCEADDEANAGGEARMHSARLVKLHLALDELLVRQPLCAKIAELRYFTGFDVEEIAELLSLPVNSVAADYRFARAWLAAASGD